MTPTNILVGILAVLALALPGVFKADHLEDWKNGVIALAVVALFSFLTVIVGGKLTGNFETDWAVFAGIYGALLAGPAQPLDQWLQSNLNLPFLKPSPINNNPVRIPSGIQLPSNIPPRSSVAQQSDKPQTPSA